MGGKIEFRGQNLTNLKKIVGQKQAGAELKKKKKFFGKKWGKTIELKGQKFTNLKKRVCFAKKNKVGLSLRKKKFLGKKMGSTDHLLDRNLSNNKGCH